MPNNIGYGPGIQAWKTPLPLEENLSLPIRTMQSWNHSIAKDPKYHFRGAAKARRWKCRAQVPRLNSLMCFFSVIHAQFKPQIPLKNFFKQLCLALLLVLPPGKQSLSLFQLFLPHLLSCSRKCVHISILYLFIWGISEITNEPSVTEEEGFGPGSPPHHFHAPFLPYGWVPGPAKGLWSHQAYVNIRYLNLCSSWVRYQVLRGAPHDPDLFGLWVSDVSVGVQIVRSCIIQMYWLAEDDKWGFREWEPPVFLRAEPRSIPLPVSLTYVCDCVFIYQF